MSEAAWKILRFTNHDDPNKCSVCYEAYSNINQVYLYSGGCNHVLCGNCVGSCAIKNQCQNCGATNGGYSPNANLTATAVTGRLQELNSGELVTFNLVGGNGNTFPITCNKQDTMEALAQNVINNTGATLRAIIVKHKAYQLPRDAKTTVRQMDITKGMRVISTLLFLGGQQ